jgi:hypothetical protein
LKIVGISQNILERQRVRCRPCSIENKTPIIPWVALLEISWLLPGTGSERHTTGFLLLKADLYASPLVEQILGGDFFDTLHWN